MVKIKPKKIPKNGNDSKPQKKAINSERIKSRDAKHNYTKTSQNDSKPQKRKNRESKTDFLGRSDEQIESELRAIIFSTQSFITDIPWSFSDSDSDNEDI